ncbi:MAG: ribosome-associated translation inhibitor RaiA [Caldilineales bacterium]|nr:ribosome-associated translation inhibitor RaiA [Caldilineales bacterium]MDW8318260.1 ribosome-associated translation inhibitor RaiA [Anaerolineae bacterium]
MQLTIKGRNMEVTDRLRNYAEKKIGKLDRFLPDIMEVRVDLAEESTRKASERYVAQVTVRSNGTLLRAEERSNDIYAAIDMVTDKLHVQIGRYKGKRRRKIERAQAQAVVAEELQYTDLVEQMEAVEEEPIVGRIVRVKRFPMTPMSEEEAIEQMELLGHDFFVFYNPADAAVNVIYRRSDGNYGLLQPELV